MINRFKIIFAVLMVFAPCIAFGQTYTTVVDDNFTRANTSVGTVTGPGTFNSPSTGAAYVETGGAPWQISGNTLTGTASGTALGSEDLLRPTTENMQDGKAAFTFTLNTGTNSPASCVVARYNSSTTTSYVAYYYQTGTSSSTFAIATFNGSTQTVLASNLSLLLTNGTSYIVTLTALGASPTVLTATIAAAATPSTILATLTASNSASGLQQAGQWGITGTYTTVNTHFTTYQAFSMGAVSATATSSSTTIGLSYGLSGGTGSDYTYQVYRDVQPNVSTSGTPYATPSSFPYTDSSVTPGMIYYYAVTGKDSGSDVADANPVGLLGTSASIALAVAAAIPKAAICQVNIGDSITYGYSLSSPSTQSAGYESSIYLLSQFGMPAVYFSNQGVSGSCWTDWQPGQSDFTTAETAATALFSAHAGAKQLFSIMLGTNDSATSGTITAPARTNAQEIALAEATISQLLHDYSSAIVVIHQPIYYAPNTYNANNYQAAGLVRLIGYNSVWPTVVWYENSLYPGRCFLGDTAAQSYFAMNYQADMTAESGNDGTFYLHPNQAGASQLGEFWAAANYRALFPSVSGARGRKLN